eukprot:m.9951 g.9951  ORF g.9951 m.9951 type:complete len:144 (-) comp4172_c0_seq1:3437-3868(-)
MGSRSPSPRQGSHSRLSDTVDSRQSAIRDPYPGASDPFVNGQVASRQHSLWHMGFRNTKVAPLGPLQSPPILQKHSGLVPHKPGFKDVVHHQLQKAQEKLPMQRMQHHTHLSVLITPKNTKIRERGTITDRTNSREPKKRGSE